MVVPILNARETLPAYATMASIGGLVALFVFVASLFPVEYFLAMQTGEAISFDISTKIELDNVVLLLLLLLVLLLLLLSVLLVLLLMA